MRGLEHDTGCPARLEGLLPAVPRPGTKGPPRFQAGKAILRHRVSEIVCPAPCVGQERLGHHRTYGKMKTMVPPGPVFQFNRRGKAGSQGLAERAAEASPQHGDRRERGTVFCRPRSGSRSRNMADLTTPCAKFASEPGRPPPAKKKRRVLNVGRARGRSGPKSLVARPWPWAQRSSVSNPVRPTTRQSLESNERFESSSGQDAISPCTVNNPNEWVAGGPNPGPKQVESPLMGWNQFADNDAKGLRLTFATLDEARPMRRVGWQYTR